MSELIYTHISLRFPGPTPMYLLNPHGMLFHDITASSLVKIDFTGNVAGDTRTPPTGTDGELACSPRETIRAGLPAPVRLRFSLAKALRRKVSE
jgi:hypothetical protein